MPKADYDLMAIMHLAYGIHHILCNIDGNIFQPTRHPTKTCYKKRTKTYGIVDLQNIYHNPRIMHKVHFVLFLIIWWQWIFTHRPGWHFGWSAPVSLKRPCRMLDVVNAEYGDLTIKRQWYQAQDQETNKNSWHLKPKRLINQFHSCFLKFYNRIVKDSTKKYYLKITSKAPWAGTGVTGCWSTRSPLCWLTDKLT